MEIKKQDKKEAKTLPLTKLPIVTLDEREMSSVSGGGFVMAE